MNQPLLPADGFLGGEKLFYRGTDTVATYEVYKAEVSRHRGPWKHLEDVEFATLEWVHWFNHRRLLGSIGDIPPAEFEALYYKSKNETSPATDVGLN